MTYLRTGLSLTATLALSVSYLPPAFAQEGPGFSGTLTLSQGIELTDDDGSVDSSITSRTGLAFGARSVTRTETLSFGLGSEIVGEFGGGSDDEFDLENTDARIEYVRRGASSALSFSASYTEFNLDDTVISSGPVFGIGTGTLIIDDGIAAITRVDVALETGIDEPFGFEVRTGYFNEDFTDTIDPDLIDNDAYYLDATALFRQRCSAYPTRRESGRARAPHHGLGSNAATPDENGYDAGESALAIPGCQSQDGRFRLQ